jgi:hypothetical protein
MACYSAFQVFYLPPSSTCSLIFVIKVNFRCVECVGVKRWELAGECCFESLCGNVLLRSSLMLLISETDLNNTG